MQEVKLSAVRLLELEQIMDSVSPRELTSVKDIRLNVGLVNDLHEVNKELSTLASDLNVKRAELLKPYQEEFRKRSEVKVVEGEIEREQTEDEKKEISDELDAKFAEAYSFEEDLKNINDLGKKEVIFEISEEKYAKLKEWFVKFGLDKYQNKKICVEICDALRIEE